MSSGSASPRKKYKREWQERHRRAKGVKPVKIAPCGTPSAYRRHLRNDEPIDDACRDAWNRQGREARKRAKKAKAKRAES